MPRYFKQELKYIAKDRRFWRTRHGQWQPVFGWFDGYQRIFYGVQRNPLRFHHATRQWHRELTKPIVDCSDYCPVCIPDTCMDYIDNKAALYRCPACGFQYLLAIDGTKFALPHYEKPARKMTTYNEKYK